MTQRRIYDFGSLLTQGRAKTLVGSLLTPGIYEGFEPTIVSPTLIEFSAGAFLLPNGVLVEESAVTQVTVPTPGSAENYTITADHDDIQALGGSSIFYTLRGPTGGPANDGIYARAEDPNPNSLALLWIRHPGAAALSAEMLSRPPTLQAGGLPLATNGFIGAPFLPCDEVLGANIVVTNGAHFSGNQYLGTLIQNTAGTGTQQYQFRIPLPPHPLPRQIDVYGSFPLLSSISLDSAGYELYTASGTTVSMDIAALNGPQTALDFPGTPAGSFVLGSYDEADPPISLGVTVTVPASSSGVFLRGFDLIGD